MHIKPAENGTSGSGRPSEVGTARKLRLAGGPCSSSSASRGPVLSRQHSKAAPDSPLRNLVSAIGHTLVSRTPARSHNGAGPSADGRSDPLSLAAGRLNAIRSSAASAIPLPGDPNPSTRAPPSTPTPSRIQQAIARTPSRRSSLSSSSSTSSSISSQKPTRKQVVPCTPCTTRKPAAPRHGGPTTPVTTTKYSVPLRTPYKGQNNLTTPTSKASCIPLPTPRRLSVSSTPGRGGEAKLTYTPAQNPRSKSIFPTTPASKPMSVANPSTPVNGENSFSTPYNKHGSLKPGYYQTPKSALAPSPLQPRNHNVSESSRRLHFGIDVAAMAEQENLGNSTPKPYVPTTVIEPTFSFDKHRLAQIKARRNSAQSLNSPAQRIRVTDSSHKPYQTPGRFLQPRVEDRSVCFDEDEIAEGFNQSPSRRRVANALF